MKIYVEGYPCPVSIEFVNILAKEVVASGVLSDRGVILNFRDPEYSPENGGWHPQVVMASSEGQIQYVTDFAFAGSDHELGFDFSLNLFQQFGLESGRELFALWQENFCT